jgi:hypothetical protein
MAMLAAIIEMDYEKSKGNFTEVSVMSYAELAPLFLL